MAELGTVFDIKRFAIHDGPGIRTTVFLKGCPLHCAWCHNPEGIDPAREIMVSTSRCLPDCRDCLAACPHEALIKKGKSIHLDRSRCQRCGRCVAACPSEALQLAGRSLPVSEVMEELERDLPFYRQSGGGATFSGGEPLAQPQFLRELLAGCKAQGIHTVVDTSGHAPFADFESILPLVDLFLYDIKIVDCQAHQRLTGVGNTLILANLKRLSRSGAGLVLRVPLVPGANDSPREIAALAEFCAALPRRHPVHLLPFHDSHAAKLRRLGRRSRLPDPTTAADDDDALERAGRVLQKRGLTVQTGG